MVGKETIAAEGGRVNAGCRGGEIDVTRSSRRRQERPRRRSWQEQTGCGGEVKGKVRAAFTWL